ncbi:MAG: hypothetical protein L0Y42_03985 [Phycisphaerales bacterium]|nr:hypothetical protein [Phycisphaerales bacterium]
MATLLRQVLPVLISIVAAIGWNDAASACSQYRREAGELNQLAWAADWYFHEHGRYPATDEQGTWFEKLAAEWFVVPSNIGLGLTADRSLPLDRFGFVLIYEPPAHPDKGGAVIRSVGANGVDDHGALDDWDTRYGPNLGYWHKTKWPALYRQTAFCAMVGSIGVGLILRWARRKATGLGLGILFVGLDMAVALPFGFDAGLWRTSVSDMPRWVDSIAGAGVFLILMGSLVLVILLVDEATRRHKIHVAQTSNLCLKCRYDLRGCATSICPECGTDQLQ